MQSVVEECSTVFLINESRGMGMVIYNKRQTAWCVNDHYRQLVMIAVEVLPMPY